MTRAMRLSPRSLAASINLPLAAMLLALIAVAFPPLANAAEPPSECKAAPFGFEWGESPEDIRGRQIELKDRVDDFGVQEFKAFGLTGVAAKFQRHGLSFLNGQLFRVRSHTLVRDDPNGLSTLSLYDEMREALTSKYGEGDEVRTPPHTAKDHPNLWFVAMLAGEGEYSTFWFVDGVSIGIIIAPGDGSIGVMMGYDCVPLAEQAEKVKTRERAKGL